ncbi:hypothetical protein B0H19DRAFT_1258190 [Mycena capillaripes]|nr:hypothetical protein B0H19DRAFT_1258190 [Mycena capillaripes]
MANERIVACGIYYYDQENITEAQLSFRVPTRQPEFHGKNGHECMYCLYGFPSYGECVQTLGEMVTKAGRALSWANQYQHRASPFKLSDPLKPGHRKIFLAAWVSEALQESRSNAGSRLSRLPQELVNLIKEWLPNTLMTLKEAEEYRRALMKERTVFVQTHLDTAYGVLFNMCEH